MNRWNFSQKWAVVILIAMLLLSCKLISGSKSNAAVPTPTLYEVFLTPTSHIENEVDQTMMCSGAFKLTATTIENMSNAFKFNLTVENITDSPATWNPDIKNAYILDGDQRREIDSGGGIFEQSATLEKGQSEQGWLMLPYAAHPEFRFYYPNCEPAYIVLQSPE